MPGWFSRLKDGLAKTRHNLVDKINTLVTGRVKLDEEFFEELEEILIQADVGVETSLELVGRLRKRVREEKIDQTEQARELLVEAIQGLFEEKSVALNLSPDVLNVILVVGVNGAGKTTTIGKLANRLKQEDWQVMVVAGDTFRAAAIDQLEIWADRAGVDLVKQHEGSDPSAVVYDALQAARARGNNVILIDTAGRLQSKVNLMHELEKIHRVIGREAPGAPQEVLLVLDAGTGQNALSQAKLFQEAAGVTGIALTKVDGTAKGGVVLAIAASVGLPVKLIGVGEGMDDLQPFNPSDFVRALFETGEEVPGDD